MKIAWFTPFSSRSAIGRNSESICSALHQTDEVDIWTFSRTDIIQTNVPVVYFDSSHFNIDNLGKYDYVVYNMGNYAGYHKSIWDVMQKHAGILLLHDQIMHNFFVECAFALEFGGNQENGEDEYLRIMRACYGKQGDSAGKARYKPYYGEKEVRIWESVAAMAYPLFEPLLAHAEAVFTHASFFVKRLRSHFYGPLGYAYLPYFSKSVKENVNLPSQFTDGSKILVVSTGIVHPLKRIDRVTEVLLANPDIAEKVWYVVIGGYEGPYGEYLEALAAGPLKGCLYLLGYQLDDILETFLQKADFCINLRYPNSEVCSQSLIEQMAFSNPVIVLDSGIFGEMPDDCVVKISLETEVQDLANAFRFLIDSKEERLEIGRRAADFVNANCTSDIYVSRFRSFLGNISQTIDRDKVVNDTIRINKSALLDLSFNQQNAPWAIDAIGRQVSKVCNAIDTKLSIEKVLGVWLGFPYALPLRREGVTRFLLYMLMAMLDRYPVACELWSYSFNEDEIRISFESLLRREDFKDRIKIVTEKNFTEVLNVPIYKRNLPWDINESLDNLADVAKEFSKAASFITAIVYLDNVIGTGKPLFVPVHDLGMYVHYDDFVAKDPLYKARFVDIRSRAENLARAGAFMFSNSEFVRREQVLKYVSSIREKRTAVVYLPVNIPKDIHNHFLSEEEIREKFGLKKPYIFCPTQVRPYKNVSILVEALALLRERNIDVTLVLTGNPSDVPKVETAVQRLKLKDRITCLSNVTENELYSLYHYAAAAAVPTLFEGGFPWQACEALFMDAPLVLSDIPVVRERIEFSGMNPETCGVRLFDPNNPLECALALEQILLNKEEALVSQKILKEKLLSYSWYDAVERYYNIFFADQINSKNT